MNDSLDAQDFDRFFRAVRTGGCSQIEDAPRPFPWQQRLVEELLAGAPFGRTGKWPDLLALPTGSGKTTTIDIAVFVLACRDDAPRRIVFVVDRRVVVQQAATWARSLAEQLNAAVQNPDAADPVVASVARRLAAKSGVVPGDDRARRAVIAAELRGGIAADTTWAERPDIPAIITSTVDQVGSRLLMQGYGISDSMRPVHAGLLANDVLFLLDEVHLSQPFAETLRAVKKYRRRSRSSVWPGELDRWQVVQLSATPTTVDTERSTAPIDRFELTEADRSGVLGQRLAARKAASIVVAPKAKNDADPNAAMAMVLADYALAVADRSEVPKVVAVVANRVAIATAVATRLERAARAKGAKDRPDVLLLTGRMRPFDRDRVLNRHLTEVTTGRDRSALTRHVFIVGTQSIEAGVDFDVDALVTQSASLDALKQRFGRVDRRGELAAAGRPSASVIVCAPPSRQSAPDPVYGEALSATETWLLGRKQVDFGIQHLVVEGPDPADLCVKPRRAPVLLPTHLNAWAQNPIPHFAPEVSAWLHGPESADDPDVAVVWRRGVVGQDSVFVDAILDAVPIRPDEAVDVPLSHVRRWLRQGRPDPDLTDVEGAALADEDRRVTGPRRRFIVLTPDGTVTGQRPSAIKPGDTVLVDVSEGGLTMGNWDPTATSPVADLSAVRRPVDPDDVRARSWQRRPQPVRLDLALTEAEEQARRRYMAGEFDTAGEIRTWASSCPAPVTDPDLPQASAADIRMWSAAMPLGVADASEAIESGATVQLRALSEICGSNLPEANDFALIEIPSEESAGTIVFACKPIAGQSVPGSDRASASTIGVKVGLSEHGDDTAQWAQAYLCALGIPKSVAADHPITVAARYHDIGKADPRFQLQLWEGQFSDALLAKSSIPPDDWRRRRVARASSGYPSGGRHELLSAGMLIESSILNRPDGELVGHLVASHHGVGRPFAPALSKPDEGPPTNPVQIGEMSFTVTRHHMVEVGSPIADWFWRSVREHGWFGNAWLTALLRLADHEASRRPTEFRLGGNDGSH